MGTLPVRIRPQAESVSGGRTLGLGTTVLIFTWMFEEVQQAAFFCFIPDLDALQISSAVRAFWARVRCQSGTAGGTPRFSAMLNS
jgi:hypothetical protein